MIYTQVIDYELPILGVKRLNKTDELAEFYGFSSLRSLNRVSLTGKA
jgi:hypothetical protein